MAAISSHSLVFGPEQAGPRDVPKARFIEDVPEFVGSRDVEEIKQSISILHSKYCYMRNSLETQKLKMEKQIPEIEKGLEAVNLVKNCKKKSEMRYPLTNHIYGMCEIEPTDTVCLCLGAGTIVEFTPDDALEIIKENQTNLEKAIVELDQALEFIRAQTTTSELNLARVHNYGVRRAAGARAAGGGNINPSAGAAATTNNNKKKTDGSEQKGKKK